MKPLILATETFGGGIATESSDGAEVRESDGVYPVDE